MRIHKTKMCIGLCLCLILAIPLFGQEGRQRDTSDSCREFVGEFYAWYLANALRANRFSDSDIALKARPYLFSQNLVRQLKEDSEAQEKAGSDLVSLDFDSFLGGDGPAERYIVERIAIKDGRCWAEVYGVWQGKENRAPDVTPELLFKNDRWRFVNFYFPTPSAPKAGNLLDALAADRELPNKNGPRSAKKP